MIIFLSGVAGKPLGAVSSAGTSSALDVIGEEAVEKDTETESYYEAERSWSRAFGQGALANITIWGYDRYISQDDFADISLESMESNIREGFVWDNSPFYINQILHPYQGSLYHNAARYNGFNYYESIGFTAVGSLLWEYLAETGNPAINDFVTTVFGGAALGESSYRLTSLILDNNKTGREGIFREVVAAGINPVGRINAWLYGEPAPVRIDGKKPYHNLEVFTGLASASDGGWIPDSNPLGYLGFRFQYGNPYYQRSEFSPYDYYYFNMGCSINLDNPTLDVFAHALLWGRKLYPGDTGLGVVGIFQHFDYLENYVYQFASNGAGAGVQFFFPFSKDRSIETMLHLNGVALGGVDSDYSDDISGRDYSMGPGLSSKIGFAFRNDSIYTLSFMYNRYWFATVSGSDNYNTVGVGGVSFEYNVTDDIRLGAMTSFYDRWSDAGLDDSKTYTLRLFLVNQM